MNLGNLHTLHSLTLRSPGSLSRVTSFTLSYSYVDSDDDDDYIDVRDEAGLIEVFDGNTAQNTDVEHEFIQPLVARSLRLRPKTWKRRVVMTWALMGCTYGAYHKVSALDAGLDSFL